MKKYLIYKKSKNKSTDFIDVEKLNEPQIIKTGSININQNSLGIRKKAKYNNNKCKTLKKR